MHRMLLRMLAAATLAIAVAACGGGTPAPDQAPAAQAPAAGAPASDSPAAPPAPQAFAAQPEGGYTGDLPPLPQPSFATARPPQIIRAVYTFAARHPEVLRYVPCFCGCESRGHKDNADCFIAGRDVSGRPRWEEHGMG